MVPDCSRRGCTSTTESEFEGVRGGVERDFDVPIEGSDKKQSTPAPDPWNTLKSVWRSTGVREPRVLARPHFDPQQSRVLSLTSDTFGPGPLQTKAVAGQAQARGGIVAFAFQSASSTVAPKETLATYESVTSVATRGSFLPHALSDFRTTIYLAEIGRVPVFWCCR